MSNKNRWLNPSNEFGEMKKGRNNTNKYNS